MEDKFTKKEIQVYKIIHTLRKRLYKGEITIKFHNKDVDILSSYRPEIRLSGRLDDQEFVKLLTSIFENGSLE